MHVAFRQKLSEPITLREMKEWAAEKGHPLAEMHMLRMGRISVSRVREEEWKWLVGEMGRRGDVVAL